MNRQNHKITSTSRCAIYFLATLAIFFSFPQESAADKSPIGFSTKFWAADVGSSDSGVFLYGGTLRFTPPGSPYDFLFTYLAGSANNKTTNERGQGTSDIDRQDMEVGVRYHVSNSNFSLFGGFRYLEVEDKFTGANAANSFNLTQKIYWGSVGAGYWVGLTSNNRHKLFADSSVGLGIDRKESAQLGNETGISAGLDFTGGYAMTIGSNISVDARYRVLVQPDPNNSGAEVIHGPSFGASMHF